MARKSTKPAQDKKSTDEPGTGIISGGFGALADSDFGKLMSEDFAGLDLTFDRIKIPSGGGLSFEIPGDDPDDPDTVKEFSAVILYHHPLLVYYKDKYTGGNLPPDCSSFDAVTGEGNPGGSCDECPLNEFGSADEGLGKACKARRRLYLLREGEIFPMLLSLPTGSIKPFTKYMMRLFSHGGKHINSVVTLFSLKKAENSTGITYSQAQFSIDRVLTPDEKKSVDEMAKQLKAVSRLVDVKQSEVSEYEERSTSDDGEAPDDGLPVI